jgi:hypothetical protein
MGKFGNAFEPYREMTDLTVRIERDAVSGGVAPDEPGFAREDLARVIRIGVCLGVFAAGDTADQPGAVAEPLVDTLRTDLPCGSPPAATGCPRSGRRCSYSCGR